MKTTTYICDTCKKSVSQNDLVELTLGVKNLFFNQESSYSRNQVTKDICKECLKKKGFVIEENITKDNKDEIFSKNERTLESKIIDILEDLGIAFTSQL